MPQPDEGPRLSVAREGWRYIIGLAALGAFSLLMGGTGWAVFFFLLALLVASFFRDPERTPPAEPGAVVAPADGRVIAIEKIEGGGRMIGVFLSIYNVHINRSPVAGVIRAMEYRKGSFLAAFSKEAAQANEQNAIDIQTESGENFRVVQIAGVLARRIVNWRKKGDILGRGERIGLIQFGSRTDLYVPPGYETVVEMGEKIRGGETTVARPSQK